MDFPLDLFAVVYDSFYGFLALCKGRDGEVFFFHGLTDEIRCGSSRLFCV